MDTQTPPSMMREEESWPTIGRPGSVPLDALIGNPNQPRKHFDPVELTKLAETMKKGGQREILTVRHLTTAEKAGGTYPASARYMIVSGERRWKAARLAKLDSIDIRVRAYPFKKEELLDAYMLNENRVGLSDIENARALDNLAKEWGWITQEEIARGIGKPVSLVSQLLALLRLCPEAQARFDPELPDREQFTRQVGVFLARTEDYDEQRELVAGLPKECRTASQQINWMTRQLKKKGVELPTRRLQPRKLRARITDLAKYIVSKTDMLRAAPNFERLLENVPQGKVGELTSELRSARGKLSELIVWIDEKIQERPAPAMNTIAKPEAIARPAPPKSPAQVREAAERFAEKRKVPEPRKILIASVPRIQPAPPILSAPVRDDRPPARPISPKPSPDVAASLPLWQRKKEITANYFDERIGRLVTSSVPLSHYVKLWDAGLLEFQYTKCAKPTFLPTREEVVKAMRP